jgi:hypothetical protein
VVIKPSKDNAPLLQAWAMLPKQLLSHKSPYCLYMTSC